MLDADPGPKHTTARAGWMTGFSHQRRHTFPVPKALLRPNHSSRLARIGVKGTSLSDLNTAGVTPASRFKAKAVRAHRINEQVELATPVVIDIKVVELQTTGCKSHMSRRVDNLSLSGLGRSDYAQPS